MDDPVPARGKPADRRKEDHVERDESDQAGEDRRRPPGRRGRADEVADRADQENESEQLPGAELHCAPEYRADPADVFASHLPMVQDGRSTPGPMPGSRRGGGTPAACRRTLQSRRTLSPGAGT